MNRAPAPQDPRGRTARGGVSLALARARAGTQQRWIVTGVIALAVSGLIAIGLLVIYPRVGAWMIRD